MPQEKPAPLKLPPDAPKLSAPAPGIGTRGQQSAPETAPPPTPPAAEEPEENPESGLRDLDIGHAVAGMLGSGFWRAFVFIPYCVFTYGVVNAIDHVPLIADGWRSGGFSGAWHSLLAVPGALASGEWFGVVLFGITEPFGAPYLLLGFTGLMIAIRSELHIFHLLFAFTFIGAIHAAAHLKMTHWLSVLLLLVYLGGITALYVWFCRRRRVVE